MAFDPAAARVRFLAGIAQHTSSTQAWGIEEWSRGWRDDDGRLLPGALGPDGGAWWFRALTDPARLRGRASEISEEPLTSVSARAGLLGFIGEANQVLVHWPMDALAPAAFPMREAIGANESINVLVDTLPRDTIAEFLTWLGALEADVATRWIDELEDGRCIAELGRLGGVPAPALERLVALGALGEADDLATLLPVSARAVYVLEHRRPIAPELLEAAVEAVDDDTFEQLTRKLLRSRQRATWEVLTRRPLPTLVETMLRHLDGPSSPWIRRYLEAGGDGVLDALLGIAAGRRDLSNAAVRALVDLDRTSVLLRTELLDGPTKDTILDRLGHARRDLPELPRSAQKPWMIAATRRHPRPEPDWLDLHALPDLVTLSGHRLPTDLHHGIVALLQEVSFDIGGDSARDQYDSALWELRGLLDPASANFWWNTLFAMWWTHHRPEVRWVIYAAAFLCDGHAIRDLGAKLRRHRTWFGNLSPRVVTTLGHSPTQWAVAALDDISRRGRSPSHRSLARDFIERRAQRDGKTVERYVDANFPWELDPLLLEIAALRLEEAMIEGRRWTDWTWRELLTSPPFADAAQALLWTVDDGWEQPRVFRWEGNELVDIDDQPIGFDDDAAITVTHPADLTDDDLDRWHQRFADYEIVQPFDQLERPRLRASSLSKDGFQSPVGQVFDGRELVRLAGNLGYAPTREGAHGSIVGLQRDFAHFDVRAQLRFTEAIEDDGAGESALAGIRFLTMAGDTLEARQVPPAAFSEAHTDLTRLFNARP